METPYSERPFSERCKSADPSRSSPGAWLDHAGHGLLTYYMTSLIAVFGVAYGHQFLKAPSLPRAMPTDFLAAFANWDGEHYVDIADKGYRYDAALPSNIAFFPALPLLGRWLANLTGLRTDAALLIIAHVSLAGAFILLVAYVRRRAGAERPELAPWVLIALGVWPTTFFLRMAYSESLFLLGTLAALYGMEHRWPPLAIALVCGFAAATRSVGICLVVPFAWHLWRSSEEWTRWAWRLGWLPLACWGLFAFMLFQYLEFGNALAFAQTQDNWRMRPAVSCATKVGDLLTLESVRGVFDPESPCYWQRSATEINPLFSLHFANPIYWLTGLLLIGIGAWKRWLTSYELWIAMSLLLVPYVFRGHEMCMTGMARFTAVVFPIYLVLAQLLVRLPAPVAAAIVAISSFFLGAYAALFAAWHPFF